MRNASLRESVGPAGTFVIVRTVEGDSHLTRPVAPERTREKDRPANILPAVPHTKVLTEAPVVAESRRRKSRIHEIFAQ